MKNRITTIAFDADDTLWVNEPYFQDAEKQFCRLLENYAPQQAISQELFKTEMRNLSLYGYGIKGFVLCMIETATIVSNKTVSPDVIDKILAIGHELLQKPIELLPGVLDTLEQLKESHQLIVATKGDLLDQERKLKKSGLERYFDHIEIMSDKKVDDYQRLLNHLGCQPENFLMLGNSIQSDILPVLDLGAHGAHIPYTVTWTHEQSQHEVKSNNFIQLQRIDEVLSFLT